MAWNEIVAAWIEEVCGEPVPDDADDMSRKMWDYYRTFVMAAAQQCPARTYRSTDHICRCVHYWTRWHTEHRCACSAGVWTNDMWIDAGVNVNMPEDG